MTGLQRTGNNTLLFPVYCPPDSSKTLGKAPWGILDKIDRNCSVNPPGIPNSHPLIVAAKQQDIPIWSDVNLAYHFCKAPIIALTGTNGKTTTTLMVKELLTLSGLNVFCGGNIGRPCSDIIFDPRDYDIYVWELSSFQLEYCPHFRADYSSILNISPDHAERYETFSQYKKAKYNLLQNRWPRDFHLLPQELAEDISFPVTTYTAAEVADFKRQYDWGQFQLYGSFNQENLYVAHTLVARFLGREG